MAKECKKCSCINCGIFNKYMILLFIETFLTIALIFIRYETKFFFGLYLNPIISNISSSFGSLLSFIVFIIYTISHKGKNNKTDLPLIKKNNMNEISMPKKILWILLVSIIAFIYIILDCFIWINDNDINTFAFYFIFLTFFSNLLLKNKLYKHHYISIIIMIILDFIYSIIIVKESIIDIYEQDFSFFTIISYILFYSLELVFYKYYMLKKYIQSYEILFFKGLFLSIFLIITLIILIKKEWIYSFWNYYEIIDLKEIIILVSMTLIYFIYNLLQLIIIDYFSPYHILLTNLIPEKIFYLFFDDSYETEQLIVVIVILLIYTFMILVFIEFIQLNFLGLSKMTKKNIDLRAKNETMEYDINDIINDDEITLDGYKFELGNKQLPDENSVPNN